MAVFAVSIGLCAKWSGQAAPGNPVFNGFAAGEVSCDAGRAVRLFVWEDSKPEDEDTWVNYGSRRVRSKIERPLGQDHVLLMTIFAIIRALQHEVQFMIADIHGFI